MFQQTKLFVLFTCLLIVGCSSIEPVKENAKQAINLHDHISEWKKIKPELEELISLKSEIKTLITDLNQLSQYTNDSLKTNETSAIKTTITTPMTPQTLISPNINAAKAHSNENTDPITNKKSNDLTTSIIKKSSQKKEAITNNIAIQLGSYSTLQAVEKSWNNLQLQFATELSDKRLATESTLNSQNNTIHRLKVTPFVNLKNAQNTCASLIKSKQACILTTVP